MLLALRVARPRPVSGTVGHSQLESGTRGVSAVRANRASSMSLLVGRAVSGIRALSAIRAVNVIRGFQCNSGFLSLFLSYQC